MWYDAATMKLRGVFFGLSVLTLSLSALAGCAAQAVDSSEVAGESEEATVISASRNSGYFLVTGTDATGLTVKRVNETHSVCADGSVQTECHVARIDLGGLGLSEREEAELSVAVESGHALVKARTYKQTVAGAKVGVLKATEGWVGATGSVATGTFYRVADNGLRCIKAPCPSITAYGLNGADDRTVIDTKFATDTLAAPEAVAKAERALGTSEGILIGGAVASLPCEATNCGALAMVSELYFRVTASEGKSCGGRGVPSCNAGQFCNWKTADICGAADAGGSCSYKPRFCFALAAPVCGCDGKTYGNSCYANTAGVSISSVGACAP